MSITNHENDILEKKISKIEDEITNERKLPLTRLGDLLKEKDEEKPWLVHELLPTGGLSLLAGKPKVGKSTLARNLAITVARGEPFLGRESIKGPVIYLALEEKREEVKKHFRDMGGSADEEIYIFTSSAPPDLIAQLKVSVGETKPVLIIADTLFRVARVRDSNDYTQVLEALEPLLDLARTTNAHVLAVHHLGKGERSGGDAILGSTAIYGSVDTALLLKRSSQYRTIVSFQRYGKELEESMLEFDEPTRTVFLGETKDKAEEGRIAKTICQLLGQQQGGVEESVIQEAVKGKKLFLVPALRQLVNDGKVIRNGKGVRGDPYLYRLSNSGSLVPTYIQEPENQNAKKKIFPSVGAKYSGSQKTTALEPDDIFSGEWIYADKERCKQLDFMEGLSLISPHPRRA